MLFIETKLDDNKILLNVDSIGYMEPHRHEKDKTIVYFKGQVGNVNFATIGESYDQLLAKIHDPCKSSQPVPA